MSFNGTWANADGSLALIISNAGMDGSFEGKLTYGGNSYPLQNGHWHIGDTSGATYSFAISVDGSNQIYIGASGVITGSDLGGGMPSQITIAGAAATLKGSAPTPPNSLSLFAGILNPQN